MWQWRIHLWAIWMWHWDFAVLSRPRQGSADQSWNRSSSETFSPTFKDHSDYGDCVPKSEGICRAHGDPHLKTFDGATYDITGTCEYYMVISTKESANQSPFNVRFKSFRRKPKEMVPWIETVFEFKSRDYKSTFVIEMSRNKISKSIDTIVTQSTGSGESELRKVSKSLGKTQDFEIVSDGNRWLSRLGSESGSQS